MSLWLMGLGFMLLDRCVIRICVSLAQETRGKGEIQCDYFPDMRLSLV